MQKLFALLILIFCVFSLNAQTITLTETSPEIICSSSADTVAYKVTITNIPANANIVVYESTNPTFNPYLGQGTQITNVKGDSIQSANSCIRMLGLFIDACLDGGGDEGQNEYMTISSGSGIKVSNLAIDFGKSNNAQGVTNADINFGAGACLFRVPQAALITNLRANAPCSNANIIPTGPTDSIPPNAIILIFTSDDVRSIYNMSALCAKGFPIYVLQNDCRRTIGAFSNISNSTQNCTIDSNRYRHYVVRNLATGCYDSLVYDRCHSTSGYVDGSYVVNLPGIDTLSVANGGIKSSTGANACSGINYTADGLNYTEIVKNTDTTFRFALSPAFCNDGYHYIKAITNPPGTQPISNTIKFKLVCLDVATNISRQEICSGQNAPFSISSTDANATFSWTVSGGASITGASTGSGNSINQTLTYNGATRDSLTYNITANDAGCTKTTSVKVVVNKCSTCTAFNLGNDTSYCGSFSRVLTAGNPATIWSTGATASSITVTQSGTYTATCGAFSDAITISQSPGIPFDFGANTTSVCVGGNISLDASIAYDSYIWSTNAVTHAITITMPGKYWVDVFKNGCKGSDTITVVQIDKEPKPNLGRDTSYCGTFSKVLSTGNVQTEWFRNGTSVTTASSLTVNQPGTYVAKVSNSCGSVSDTIVISSTSGFILNLGRDTIICAGNVLNLDATVLGNNISYLWSTSEQTARITVSDFGKYSVEVSNGSCTVSDTILVDILNKPTIGSLGSDTTVCGNLALTLYTGDAITKWSNGATGPQITVTQSGTYIATNQNVCGSAKDTIEVKQFAKPTVNLGSDSTICDSIILSVGNGNFTSILWNTNDTTSSIVVTASGVYTVRVTNANCSNIDSVKINKECFYDVYVPSAFSANSDGINDVIVPLSYIKGMQVLSFVIFNRWGEKVFEATNFAPGDLANGWNGIFKGEPAQVDNYVYYFTAKMPDDKVKVYKGTFALVR